MSTGVSAPMTHPGMAQARGNLNDATAQFNSALKQEGLITIRSSGGNPNDDDMVNVGVQLERRIDAADRANAPYGRAQSYSWLQAALADLDYADKFLDTVQRQPNENTVFDDPVFPKSKFPAADSYNASSGTQEASRIVRRVYNDLNEYEAFKSIL